MNITLNGQKIKYENQTSLSKLLEHENYADKKIAVAINGHFIPRSSHEEHIIKDGDEIEIVAPMQGG